jgi:hypothetical protein
MPLSLPMLFAAKAHRAEGQFGSLKSTLNKPKSLKCRSGTYRSTVSKRVGKYFEPLKTSIKNKGDPGNASEHLSCVSQKNYKH